MKSPKFTHLPVEEDYLMQSTERLAESVSKPAYSRIADRLQTIREQSLEDLADKCGELAKRHALLTNQELKLEIQKLARQLKLTPPAGSRAHLVGWLKSVHFAITGKQDEDQINRCLQVLSRTQAPERSS